MRGVVVVAVAAGGAGGGGYLEWKITVVWGPLPTCPSAFKDLHRASARALTCVANTEADNLARVDGLERAARDADGLEDANTHEDLVLLALAVLAEQVTKRRGRSLSFLPGSFLDGSTHQITLTAEDQVIESVRSLGEHGTVNTPGAHGVSQFQLCHM